MELTNNDEIKFWADKFQYKLVIAIPSKSLCRETTEHNPTSCDNNLEHDKPGPSTPKKTAEDVTSTEYVITPKPTGK